MAAKERRNALAVSGGSLKFLRLCRRMKEDGLAHIDPAGFDHRSVDPGIVLVQAYDCLHHLGGKCGRVRVNVQHGTANVARGHRDRHTVRSFAEGKHAAYPFVFLKRQRTYRANQNVGTEAPNIYSDASEP